jgi:hypothetical protein
MSVLARYLTSTMDAALSPGPLTHVLENLSAEWDLSISEDRIAADHRALYDAAADRNDSVRALTGESLNNEYGYASPSIFADRQAKVNERLGQIRRQFPNVPIPTDAEMRGEVLQRERATFERTSDIRARATGLGRVAGALGSMAAIATDPPMLATMFLGAPAAAGTLRFLATEAAINIGAEAAAIGSNAALREKLGRPISLEEAATRLAFAGVGGAAIAGLAKGGAAAVRALARIGRQGRLGARGVDAGAHLERYQALLDERPAGIGGEEHRSRFDAATGALREGRAVELGEAGPRVVDARDAARVAEREAKFAAERGRITEALPEGGDLVRAGRLAAEAAGTEADRAAALGRLEFMATEGDLGGQLALLRKPPRTQPLTLLGWLKRVGGLKDDRGELRARGIIAGRFPGVIGGRKARSLEDRARGATEAGFFPEFADASGRGSGGVASADDLLRAIDQEKLGRPRIAPEHEDLAALHEQVRDADALFGRAGIDVKDKTDEQVRAAIVDAAAEVRARAAEPAPGVDPATVAEEEMARLEDDDEAGMLADEAAFMADRIREDVGDDMPFDAPPEEREGALAASRFMLDEGAEKSGADILDELDLDAAAIKAVEDCLL